MRSQSFVVVFLMILRLFRWYAQKSTAPMTISFVSDDRFERPGEHRQILIIYKPPKKLRIIVHPNKGNLKLIFIMFDDSTRPGATQSFSQFWISLYFSTNFSSIDSPLIFIFSRGSAAASLFPILNHSHRFDSQSIYGRFFNLFILPAIFAVGFICCVVFFGVPGWKWFMASMKRWKETIVYTYTHNGPQELMARWREKE